MGLPSLNLQVRVSGVPVGRLIRNRQGAVVFRPDPDWLHNSQRPRLSLAFLSRQEFRQDVSGIPAWFEHLLPASQGALRARIASEQGGRSIGSSMLLRLLGRDLPGAVEVSGAVEEEQPGPEQPAPHLTFSLAGMQLKFSMEQKGERFSLPAKDQSGRWIVKLPGSTLPELPEVELATMAWAAASGFETPECRVVSTDVLVGIAESLSETVPSAFAIKRFDRPSDGSRIHQEDLAQVLDFGVDHLYGRFGSKQTSYDLLVRLVSDACGSIARDDFIQRVAFVVASGNGDAHLKNWSLQWRTPQRPTLSPCYDQVCTIAWNQYGWQSSVPKLALAFGRARTLHDLDSIRVGLFAQRSQSPGAEDRFYEALHRARDSFIEIVELCPPRMLQALDMHWARVPVLRAIGGLKKV